MVSQDGLDNQMGYVTTPFIYSEDLDKVWGSIGVVLGLFTIAGNIIVFVVLLRMKKRTLSDNAFINLAVIDVISGISAVAGSSYLINNRIWFRHPHWKSASCYFTGMSWNTASLTTPLLVSVVSFGRVSAVYVPLRFDQVFTPLVVYITIAYCWAHGIVASCLSIMGNTGQGTYVLIRKWGFCDQSIREAFSDAALYRGLYIMFFTVPMILTCVCIVTCNLLVMWKIVLMKVKGTEVHSEPRISVSLGATSTSSVPMGTQYIRHVQKKLSRRLSQAYHGTPGNGTSNANSETSFSRDRCVDESEECVMKNSYRHFEIVSIGEGHSKPGGGKTEGKGFTRGNKVKKGTHRLRNQVQRRRKAKRENRAILMTLFVSLSYLLCYLEIINYYISASFGGNGGLFGPMFGGGKYSKTYTNLWYYYSLFVAACINAILHLLFNQVIRKGVHVLRRSSATSIVAVSQFGRNSSRKI